MIRQAISCDICGTEKKQTNHWFVATEQGGELRVSGWNSRHRLRAETKHLCGQTCLHKLMDEFVARTNAARVSSISVEDARDATDTSLTGRAPRVQIAPVDREAGAASRARMEALEPEYARVVEAPRPVELPKPPELTKPLEMPKPVIVSPLTLVSMPIRTADAPTPIYTPRHSREAWERERERTQQRGDLNRPHKRF